MNEAEVRRLTDRLSLPDLLERHPRRRGAANLRALLGGKAPGGITRNDFEELFVAFLDAHGLPRPRLNADARRCAAASSRSTASGRTQRLDRRARRRAVHGTDRAFEGDRERDRILLAEGWRSTRVTWRQLRDEPAAIAADLRPTARRSRRRSAATGRCALGDLLPLSHGPGALRALPARREPARAGRRRRLHRRRRGRRLRRPLADLARGRGRADRRGQLRRRGLRGDRAATAAVAEMVDGAPVLEAAAIGIDDGRRRDRRPDAGQAPRRPARRRRAAPGAGARRRRLRPGSAARGLAAAAASASRSPCPAASTAPSRRCSSASAGRRWSRSRSSSGPTRRPTAPRPAARRRRCSAPAGSPTRSASRTSPSTSRRNSAAASSARFIAGYAAGSTPNPCVLCNGEVRIAAMVDLAERLGAEPPGHRPLRPHRRGRRRAAARLRRRRGQGPELHARGAAAGAARPARASRSPS